jgi:hypothetical protein
VGYLQTKEVQMNDNEEVLRTLGRIEGRVISIDTGFEKLVERVSKLEMWQAWLKGVWVALVGAWFYLFKQAAGK